MTGTAYSPVAARSARTVGRKTPSGRMADLVNLVFASTTVTHNSAEAGKQAQ